MDEKPRLGWFIYPAASLFVFVFSIVFFWLMDLVAGKLDPSQFVLCLAFGATAPLFLFLLNSRGRSVLSHAPEELEARIEKALGEAGIRRATLAYWDKGEQASYPRPFAFGKKIAISRRVAEGLSPAALEWSVKTDSVASWQGTVRGFPLLFLGLLAVSVCGAGMERWKLPDVFVLLPLAFLALSFTATGFYAFRLQVLADRRFTTTDYDRAAAKEALSFAYFAQEDRPSGSRWLFSRRELAGRARRLGIVLERGFRAGPGEVPQER